MDKYNDLKPQEGLEVFHDEFCEDRLNEFQDFETFLDTGQFNRIEEISHKWKGFCEPYGFQTLGIFAKQLEELCVTKDKSQISKLFVEIQTYLKTKQLKKQN